MSDSPAIEVKLCRCGGALPTPGAKRCVKCKAAHARKGIKQRAYILKLLPSRAGPMTEADWVAANLGMRQVNLYSAPSRAAVHLLAALNKDDKLRRSFWVTNLKTRLKRSYD